MKYTVVKSPGDGYRLVVDENSRHAYVAVHAKTAQEMADLVEKETPGQPVNWIVVNDVKP